MAKQDSRRPKGDTGEAEIYTEDVGTPPVDPDMGSVKGAKPLPTSKPVKKASGGSVGSASKRADGCAVRGKTKGRML